MARKKDPSDEEIRILVREAVAELGDELADSISDKVMDAVTPLIGAAAERRRNESDMREAFKEGFFTSKRLGQFARWHTMLWRHSSMFQTMKAKSESTLQDQAAQSRYADFNY